MLIQIFGFIAGFVLLCRLGACLSQWLYDLNKWIPLAVVAPVAVGMDVYLFVFDGEVDTTLRLWFFAFVGGMLSRAQKNHMQK